MRALNHHIHCGTNRFNENTFPFSLSRIALSIGFSSVDSAHSFSHPFISITFREWITWRARDDSKKKMFPSVLHTNYSDIKMIIFQIYFFFADGFFPVRSSHFFISTSCHRRSCCLLMIFISDDLILTLRRKEKTFLNGKKMVHIRYIYSYSGEWCCTFKRTWSEQKKKKKTEKSRRKTTEQQKT